MKQFGFGRSKKFSKPEEYLENGELKNNLKNCKKSTISHLV